MSRNLFRGAPELSRLFAAAPTDLLREFLTHPSFQEMVGGTMSDLPDGSGERLLREELEARLRLLGPDRTNLIETQARRIMAMSDSTPDALLLRLAESPRFRADEVRAQRDAVARSLWAYLRAEPLLEATERAMQVRVFRDHGKLYEAWTIDTPIPLAADAVDEDALGVEIAARLHHQDGCKVEAVDLPSDDGVREVLVAVTFFGAYSSQRTVRPDKSTDVIYFRPPDELLLVYSPASRRIEICSRDPAERSHVARAFAEDVLGHDVSNKPLTQKTYNLARFRKSLRLPIPESHADRVKRASVIEVQVALGEWSRKVSLAVAPEDNIDTIARSVFGAILPHHHGGFVTRVRFHIEHLDGRGRSGTLKFDLFGRNASNIQSERDPDKRRLGYELLEAWGVLARVADLTRAEIEDRLPKLLKLYDLTDARISGRVLDELDIDGDELVRAGFLSRIGWSDVILFEDDELGPVLHTVERDGSGAPATLNVGDGGAGPQVPAEEVEKFEVRFDYLRDALTETLKPLELAGKVRRIDEHLHQLGTAQVGLAAAPVYLARGMSDDRLLERADRLLRGEHANIRGIVFVPCEPRFPYMGPHVVLGLRELLQRATGEVDAETVRLAYETSVVSAAKASSVHFSKQSDDAAHLIVPGQEPRVVIGAKKVLLFERLYMAHRDRQPEVKLSALREYAGFSQLQQLFRSEWSDFKDRYLYSPRHGYWALCSGPISV